MDDVLFPLAEAQKIVDAFEDCSLPNEDWTHEAHLIVALSLLARYGDTAFEEMKKRLLLYNPTVGRAGTFHATMTWFWLKIIQKHLTDAVGKILFDQSTVDELLFDEDLSDRNLWLQYYPKELMMSENARAEIVKQGF